MKNSILILWSLLWNFSGTTLLKRCSFLLDKPAQVFHHFWDSLSANCIMFLYYYYFTCYTLTALIKTNTKRRFGAKSVNMHLSLFINHGSVNVLKPHSKLKTVTCSMELLKIQSETPQSEPKSGFHSMQPSERTTPCGRCTEYSERHICSKATSKYKQLFMPYVYWYNYRYSYKRSDLWQKMSLFLCCTECSNCQADLCCSVWSWETSQGENTHFAEVCLYQWNRGPRGGERMGLHTWTYR